jgi:hypothetical protein
MAELQQILDENFSFNGNPLLKPAYAKIQMTADQLVEYMKCEADPVYFIRNYVKIISLDHGTVKFNMWDFQEKMVQAMVDNRFVICKMPRQVGKTTTTAAIILWHVLFNKEYTVALLANKMDQAQEIMERIQMMYENLPMWIQQGIVTWNKRTIKLENDSRIIAAATSSSAIRGKSINMVYLDEFAHIDRALQLKFFTSTYPVISSGQATKVIITSTPNGYELFSKMWMDAVKEDGELGKNSYVPVSVHWSDIPGRNEAWKEETINNTSADQFRQEYECEFLGSADTLIGPEYLAAMKYFRPVRKSNSINIFQEPIPGHIYVLVADVARGGGGDYSAFVVVDVTQFPYSVAATYRDNTVTPVVYPNFIHQASLAYNNAYVLVEVNDIGGQVADILNYELENESMLMVTMTGKKGQSLGGGYGKTARFGVKTTPAVKRIGCFAVKGLIENNQLMVNDFEIVSEFSTFVHDGVNYGAEYGKHDDLVMCLVLFSWATTQKYFKELVDSDVRVRILEERERQMEEDMLPFGIVNDGQDDEELVQTYHNPTFSDFDRALM